MALDFDPGPGVPTTLQGERNALKVYGQDGRVLDLQGAARDAGPRPKAAADVSDIVRQSGGAGRLNGRLHPRHAGSGPASSSRITAWASWSRSRHRRGGGEHQLQLETTGGRPSLTLFEGRTDEAGLPFCLGLTDHLADAGFAAPRPVRGVSGEWIGRLNGRPAAVIQWLQGAGLHTPTAVQAMAGGRLLGADLHLKVQRTSPGGAPIRGPGRSGWSAGRRT